jgi:hypothetical protein
MADELIQSGEGNNLAGQSAQGDPYAPAVGAKIPDTAMDDFAKTFVKEFSFVKSTLEQRSPDQAEAILSDMLKLPKDELVKTVLDTSDAIKIDTLKKSDPKFNRLSAFIRGVGDSATLGLAAKAGALLEAPFQDKPVADVLRDDAERARLLQKAYPGTSIAGITAGFLGPSVGAKAFESGANAGISGTKLMGELGEKFVEKLGADPKFAARVGGLIDNALTRSAAAGAVGSAAFTGAKGGAELAADASLGAVKPEELPNAFGQLAAKTLDQAEEGAKLGAIFGAGGMLAAGAYRTGSAALRKGAGLLGKDLNYQLNNLELVREVMDSTPGMVIAESADKMAPVIQRQQEALKAIETSAKNEITAALKNKNIQLSKEFQGTADELSNAVTELRQAGEEGVARAATNLQDTIGKAYGQRNRAYGAKLDEIVQKTDANVNLTKPLELVDDVLKKNGALDRKGQLLAGSDWAKANPELFQQLSEFWQRLGGELKVEGAGPGITKNLKDTINLQRQVGELANFGKSPTYFERVFRDLYFKIRDEAQDVAPELKPLNESFTADRAKLDEFRTVVGRTEQQIANKLRRNLDDNKNVFVREALEGFGGMTENAGAATAQGSEISRRLQVVNGFKKDPKGVFNQLRQAYLQNDTLTLSALERIAEENPRLKPYLDTAKRQADVISQLPKPGDASRAVSDPEVARLVGNAVPEARQALQTAQGARIRSQDLSRVLPPNRLDLEQALTNNGFAAGDLEKQVVAQTAQANPELQEPLQRAEAARVVQRIKTGKGMEKHALEELPILGDTIFALRKAATPLASRLINILGKAPTRTRNALIQDVWENLEGSDRFPKQSLMKLIQAVGPEAALVTYGQNGGAGDIIRAAEKTGRALSGDDEQNQRQNGR